jgi:hypothetical protein
MLSVKTAEPDLGISIVELVLVPECELDGEPLGDLLVGEVVVLTSVDLVQFRLHSLQRKGQIKFTLENRIF